jgi:hypothetical protein
LTGAEDGCVELTVGEIGGGESTDGEGGGDVEVANDETTLTSIFMPALQWPGMPHMKYLLPVLVSWIVVLPP